MSSTVLKKRITMNSSLPRFWELFKVDHEEIEKNVDAQSGSYQGLAEEALYTSRNDLLTLFQHPLVSGTLVDLGCGTGESCLLYGSLFPERKAIGVEFQFSRLQVGQKFKEITRTQNVELIHGDLNHMNLPQGQTYFFYFPTGPVLDRILYELSKRKRDFRFVAIESHGDFFKRLEKEGWLELQEEVPLTSARHFPYARIYEAKKGARSRETFPHDLSFQEKFLVIGQNDQWIGESLGLEWDTSDQYTLKTPPRTFSWKEVQDILSFDELSEEMRQAVKLRRLGEVTLQTLAGKYQGFIRKILLKPTFRLEISSGATVEWKDIKTIHQGPQLCYASS